MYEAPPMTIAATKYDVVRIIQEANPSLIQLRVKRIGLFGSFVRGSQSSESDIDILIEFIPEQKTFDHFIQIAELLEALLGRHVDLVTLESLNSSTYRNVLREVEYVSLAA